MHAERQQRVEKLRRLVATGRYRVDPDAIAEALIARAGRAQAEDAATAPLPASLREASGRMLEAP